MSALVKIERKSYRLEFDPDTGLIHWLIDSLDNSQTNIIDTLGGRFGGIVYTDCDGRSANESTRSDGRVALDLIESAPLQRLLHKMVLTTALIIPR